MVETAFLSPRSHLYSNSLPPRQLYSPGLPITTLCPYQVVSSWHAASVTATPTRGLCAQNRGKEKHTSLVGKLCRGHNKPSNPRIAQRKRTSLGEPYRRLRLACPWGVCPIAQQDIEAQNSTTQKMSTAHLDSCEMPLSGHQLALPSRRAISCAESTGPIGSIYHRTT
jgi:hypothetical protein